jgi:hypothetical protein
MGRTPLGLLLTPARRVEAVPDGSGGPAKRGVRATTVVNIRVGAGVVTRTPEGGLPEGVVYIGHRQSQGGWHLPKSKWANPWLPYRDGTREEVLANYREHVLRRPELVAALPELRGKVLGCWCKPLPCHGDVLAELADRLTALTEA